MNAYHRCTLSIDGKDHEYSLDVFIAGDDETAWKDASELLTQCTAYDVATLHSVVDDSVVWQGCRVADGVVAGTWNRTKFR